MSIWSLPIAAADARLENITRSFQRHRAENDGGDAALLLVGLLVAVVLFWLIARWTERSAKADSSWRLFLALAKAHGLSWLDCWLLWRTARARAVAEPALVFLDPRLTAVEGLVSITQRRAERLKTLRERIFAGQFEQPAPPAQ